MLHCLLYLHVKNVAARQRFLHSARLLTSLTSSLASPMNSKRGTRVKLQDFLQERSSGHKLYSILLEVALYRIEDLCIDCVFLLTNKKKCVSD